MPDLVAVDPVDLDRVPVWDAWFDADELIYSADEGVVAFRFAAESETSAARAELVIKRRFSREYRIPFTGWHVTVSDVVGVSAPDGWADMGMLESLEFDPVRSELLVASNDVCRIAVERLHVEAVDEGDRWMRRRENFLGGTSHTPWR